MADWHPSRNGYDDVNRDGESVEIEWVGRTYGRTITQTLSMDTDQARQLRDDLDEMIERAHDD